MAQVVVVCQIWLRGGKWLSVGFEVDNRGLGHSCAFSKRYPPQNYVIRALSDSLKPMTGWVLQRLSAVRMGFRQRRDLLLEFIALRHQLAVLQRTGTRRPCFRPSERLFWVFLSRWWANWQRSLIIVQPATVLRWRRRGFCAIWASGSCGRRRGGRVRISSEVRALIVRMSQKISNCWKTQ